MPRDVDDRLSDEDPGSRRKGENTEDYVRRALREAAGGRRYVTGVESKDRRYVANKSYQGTKYSSDASERSSRYGADRGLEGTKYSSDASERSSRYSADRGLEGTKYSSDASERNSARGLEGTKYSADRGLEGTRYSADRGLEGTKYSVDASERNNRRDAGNTFLRTYADLSSSPRNYFQAQELLHNGVGAGYGSFVDEAAGTVRPRGFVSYTGAFPGNKAQAMFAQGGDDQMIETRFPNDVGALPRYDRPIDRSIFIEPTTGSYWTEEVEPTTGQRFVVQVDGPGGRNDLNPEEARPLRSGRIVEIHPEAAPYVSMPSNGSIVRVNPREEVFRRSSPYGQGGGDEITSSWGNDDQPPVREGRFGVGGNVQRQALPTDRGTIAMDRQAGAWGSAPSNERYHRPGAWGSVVGQDDGGAAVSVSRRVDSGGTGTNWGAIDTWGSGEDAKRLASMDEAFRPGVGKWRAGYWEGLDEDARDLWRSYWANRGVSAKKAEHDYASSRTANADYFGTGRIA